MVAGASIAVIILVLVVEAFAVLQRLVVSEGVRATRRGGALCRSRARIADALVAAATAVVVLGACGDDDDTASRTSASR